MSIHFTKMHGLGNDFIILDVRHQVFEPTPERVKFLSNRRLGIGCDQFIVLSQPTRPEASIKMRIFNADGKEVEICGNASRCVAWLLGREGIQEPTLETIPGLLQTKVINDALVQVNMGRAAFEWQKIPLRHPLDHSLLNITFDTVIDPVAVNVGNPHIVFFVKDFKVVDIEKLGSSLSKHPLFPEGANIEVVKAADFHTLQVKVWERGVGVTPACGSGACAAAAAAYKNGLTDKKVEAQLEGGNLNIEILPDGSLLMTGPVKLAFKGSFDNSLIQ